MKLRLCLSAKTEALAALARSAADAYCDGAWYFAPHADGVQTACLVAHIDTVWDNDRRRTAPRLFCDRRQQVVWSPDGLGADDRAGVYAACRIRKASGCAVLLTDGEERGGRGATAAVTDRHMRAALSRHQYLVQLDRRGACEVVTYNRQPAGFIEWIQSFGFRETSGSFSDVAVLGPVLRRPACNVSVGYYGEHSHGEFLRLNELGRTIASVTRLVRARAPAFGPMPAPRKRERRKVKRYMGGSRHIYVYDDYAAVQSYAAAYAEVNGVIRRYPY